MLEDGIQFDILVFLALRLLFFFQGEAATIIVNPLSRGFLIFEGKILTLPANSSATSIALMDF